MVISDENETEGCHYAEVSGLDTKKRQPEKVTVACPVFPLPHGQFNAVSALTNQQDLEIQPYTTIVCRFR